MESPVGSYRPPPPGVSGELRRKEGKKGGEKKEKERREGRTLTLAPPVVTHK